MYLENAASVQDCLISAQNGLNPNDLSIFTQESLMSCKLQTLRNRSAFFNPLISPGGRLCALLQERDDKKPLRGSAHYSPS